MEDCIACTTDISPVTTIQENYPQGCKCADGYYYNANSRTCENCHSFCDSCTAYGSEYCLTCNPSILTIKINLYGSLGCVCKIGYFFDGDL